MNWMTRYTIPDSGSQLWAAVHRGDGRAVATDSRCLLAVDDPAATFAPLVLPFERDRFASGNAMVKRLLSDAPPADATTASLFDLWLWLDRVDRDWCPACRATGDVISRVPGDGGAGFPCQECDGRGWFLSHPFDPPDADTVTICGVPVDRNRLAWWLAPELDEFGERIRVWADDRGQHATATVTLAGDHWRFVVAGLDPAIHSGQYRTYYPGAGVWWSCRRCETARLAASDWATERDIDPATLFTGAA